jgi:hypothetical protein
MPEVLARLVVILQVLRVIDPLESMVPMPVECPKVHPNIAHEVADVKNTFFMKVIHFPDIADLKATVQFYGSKVLIEHYLAFVQVHVRTEVNGQIHKITSCHRLHYVSESSMDILVQKNAVASSYQLLEVASDSKLEIEDEDYREGKPKAYT